MEHRYSERAETDIKVMSYKNGSHVVLGRVTNFSAHGFFIETDTKNLQFLQRLQIVLVPNSNSSPNISNRYEDLRYYGYVMRKTDEGIGVELESMSRESARALRSLCSSAAKKNTYTETTTNITENSGVEAAAVCCKNWRQLDLALVQIVGRHALDAVYKNAMGIASLEFPWLASAQKGFLSSDNFASLQTAMTEQTSNFVLAANAAFYNAFEKLLAGLIGENLTERLLNSTFSLGSAPTVSTKVAA
jgi:PilZ domain